MNLILSVDEHWALGKQNQLLFRVAPDLQMFKERTMDGVVIMGRKTWESLPNGNPLPGRVNIILSRNPEAVSLPKTETQIMLCKDLEGLSISLDQLRLPTQKVWVIGGAEIYKMLMPYCEAAYVTRFFASDPEGDCWMEQLSNLATWVLEEQGDRQEWEGFGFCFERYRNLDVKPLPHPV